MYFCFIFSLHVYFRLHEFDEQTRWVREGMAKVIPVPLLALFTGLEIETMVGLCQIKWVVGWGTGTALCCSFHREMAPVILGLLAG